MFVNNKTGSDTGEVKVVYVAYANKPRDILCYNDGYITSYCIDVNAKDNHIVVGWQIYKRDLLYDEFYHLCSLLEATTSIYETIKKGLLWEGQVDLLLEYGAKLDESCLEAARLSGDDVMIKKVESLMKGGHL